MARMLDLARGALGAAFVTDDILARTLARLYRHRIDANSHLVQLGCGRGTVGLHLAERTGARLTGIDSDPLAIGNARRNARNYRLAHEPRFDCATFEATWIEPALAHAVISLDALHLARRPLAALAEAHRILVAGGILAFDVFVPDDDPRARAWVRMLEHTGFVVTELDDQTHVWRRIAESSTRRLEIVARKARFSERAS